LCDAISVAIPIPSRQVLDSYTQRSEGLEDSTFGFSRVKKVYKI